MPRCQGEDISICVIVRLVEHCEDNDGEDASICFIIQLVAH